MNAALQAARQKRNDEIARLFLAGKMHRHIARQLRVSMSLVSVVLRERDLKPADGGFRIRVKQASERDAQAAYREKLLRKHHYIDILHPPFPSNKPAEPCVSSHADAHGFAAASISPVLAASLSS